MTLSGRATGAGSHGPRSLALDLAVLLGLLMAAAWLRAPALAPSSLWLDDAWVALVHRTEGWQQLRYVGFAAPGFVAGLKAWFALAGTSELAAQFPAFLAGSLTPPLAYVLARWRRWHRAAASLAGIVLVTSPIAITYATRVKQYTTEALFGVLLVGLALWLLDDRGDQRRWFVFVGVGAAATVVSAFLAPSVAAGLLAALVAAGRNGDRTAAVRAVGWGALYGAAALIWYVAVLAPAITSSISGFWADGFLTVGEGLGPLLASLRSAAAGVLTGLLPVPVWFSAVLVIAALGLLLVNRAFELTVLLLTPLGIAVVLAGLQLAPLGGGRTDAYLYPSLALLLAAGAQAGLRGAQRQGRRAAAVAGMVLVLSVSAVLATASSPVRSYPSSDVRPLVAEVERRAGDDDAILVYPATVWAFALYTSGDMRLEEEPVSPWGFSPRFADPRVVVLPPGRNDPGAYLQRVGELRAGDAEVVWLVASHWREDIDALREQLAQAGFDGVEVARRDGARLERYDRVG